MSLLRDIVTANVTTPAKPPTEEEWLRMMELIKRPPEPRWPMVVVPSKER